MSVLIEWDSVAGAYSYNVYRSPDNISYTLIKTANPSTSYIDNIGTISDFYKISSIDRFGKEGPQSDATQVYEHGNLCNITGNIVDINGNPEENAEIVFYIAKKDSPRFAQNLLITGDIYTASTNENGYLSVYLLQEALVFMHIKNTGFSVRFVVPVQSTLAIEDIVGNFGVKIPLPDHVKYTDITISNPF